MTLIKIKQIFPSTGLQGNTGVWGITGAAGIVQGSTGIRGITGVWGITGGPGITGVWGITGANGVGVQGITGQTLNDAVGVLTWTFTRTTGVGAIFIASGIGGHRIAPRAGTFIDCFMSLGQNGSAGTSIGQVIIGTGNTNPGVNTPWSVVYANLFSAGNRPIIGAAANAASSTNRGVQAGTPQAPWDTGFLKGAVFGVNVDAAGTAAQDLVMNLIVKYTGA